MSFYPGNNPAASITKKLQETIPEKNKIGQKQIT
jgi:hypothetical protein